MATGQLGIEDMRGDKREILFTRSFLVNDLEDLRWRFVFNEQLVRLCIRFKPEDEISQNPPIRIFPDNEDTVIEFIGWNSNITYHINEPTRLIDVNGVIITFSVVNMHLGNSNFFTIQLYRDL